jgi:hypothetical protein
MKRNERKKNKNGTKKIRKKDEKMGEKSFFPG